MPRKKNVPAPIERKDILMPWITKDAEQTATHVLKKLGYLNQREQPIPKRFADLKSAMDRCGKLTAEQERARNAWTTIDTVKTVRALLRSDPEACEKYGLPFMAMMGAFLDTLMGPAYHKARAALQTERANDEARFAESCALLKTVEVELGPKARKKEIAWLYKERAEEKGAAVVYVPKNEAAFRKWRSTHAV